MKYANLEGKSALQREHLHKLRILTKEVVTPWILPPMFSRLGYTETFSETLRGVHQVLGKWHDIEIALEHFSAFQTTARNRSLWCPSMKSYPTSQKEKQSSYHI